MRALWSTDRDSALLNSELETHPFRNQCSFSVVLLVFRSTFTNYLSDVRKFVFAHLAERRLTSHVRSRRCLTPFIFSFRPLVSYQFSSLLCFSSSKTHPQRSFFPLSHPLIMYSCSSTKDARELLWSKLTWRVISRITSGESDTTENSCSTTLSPRLFGEKDSLPQLFQPL